MATRLSPNYSERPETPLSIRNHTKFNVTSNPTRSELPPHIDLSEIEIVDLTESSPPRGPRRPSDSPSSERPAKRVKGKDPEVYISLDDDDEEDESSLPSRSQTATPSKRKRPAESGSLSQAKCVVCLESPTDLVATPCGHLFCDFCIRSALHTVGRPDERVRPVMTVATGACPICRRKISTKSLINMEIKVRS